MNDGIFEPIKDILMGKKIVILLYNNCIGFLWEISGLQSFLVLVDVSFEFILLDEFPFGLLLFFEELTECFVVFLQFFCGLLLDGLEFSHSVNERVLVVLD